MLEFHDDAIVLSGLHGTGLKSKFLGMYYNYWWPITSGGKSKQNPYPTAIVDFYAGSGEAYLKDTNEIVLGSAGHALNLKFNPAYNTDYLRVIAIEQDKECYKHLLNVTSRRWPQAQVRRIYDFSNCQKQTVWLVNSDVITSIKTLSDSLKINSIFLFDPLLYEDWNTISTLALSRLKSPFKTGTEFIIFMFTSDWFDGRDFSEEAILVPLPKTYDAQFWTPEEQDTVNFVDKMFGDRNWRRSILREQPKEARMANLVSEYSNRLHSWFRYVLPLPFAPKPEQRYHLFCCTNYHAGFAGTRGFYCNVSANPPFNPGNTVTTKRFRVLHPGLFDGLTGNQKPMEWKILWQFIMSSGFGTCDARAYEPDEKLFQKEKIRAIEWLVESKYLISYSGPTAFVCDIARYILNWPVITENLKIEPESPFVPMGRLVQSKLDVGIPE